MRMRTSQGGAAGNALGALGMFQTLGYWLPGYIHLSKLTKLYKLHAFQRKHVLLIKHFSYWH